MNLDPELLKRIVADVLAQLDQLPGAAPCEEKPPRPEKEQGTKRLSLPVLAAEQVERLPRQVRVLELPRRCVVTPAARDLLRQRGIELRRVVETAAGKAAPPLVVVTDVPRQELATLDRVLQGAGVPTQRLPQLGLPLALEELARAVRLGGQRGLVWSACPQVALCLANRHRGVRAAGGEDPRQLRRHVSEVAANRLVLGPACASPWALRRLIHWFATRKLESVPPELKETSP